MKQFGRQFELEIISDKETLIVNNLRVSFDIDKTINEKPNPATFQIWNMNRDHINQILSLEFNKVVLSVGYAELRKIYSGDITKARVKRDGLDFILTLECSDGFKDYTTSRTTTTLKAGADDKQLLAEIQKNMTAVKGAVNVPNQRKLPRGRVLNGDNRDLLNRIAKNNDADWSIQDGELIFLPRDKVLNDEAILISQESGMINAPEHTDDGLELQCLLNPALAIGSIVEVRSILDHFNGQYKIVKLVHSGDAMADDWVSKITVVGGKFEKVEKEN